MVDLLLDLGLSSMGVVKDNEGLDTSINHNSRLIIERMNSFKALK